MAGLGEALAGGPPPDEEPMPAEESEYPPEFEAAYGEWEQSPGPDTMYRMIEACKGEKDGGLALLLGPKGKGK